ncbi:hypothetical protein D9611_001632 [Ephemerocybe angulata]|uniref:Uncharacterized protein n=2 Tax=Ephemerocybe angulata TaxID=980116 RepID=A0A8H5FMA8_9AGAR|nr:hypothetical protein D9611_001632 [Tulosesus angulatus]KAF6757185.1 hypothetical protein DFP72DRAFT_1066028 [Tulosesus angulatus]
MGLYSTIAGFATFGFASRVLQLGIMQRNLMSNPGGHAVATGVFGFAGYWAYQWEIRAGEIIAEKKKILQDRRRKQIEQVESIAAEQLAQ